MLSLDRATTTKALITAAMITGLVACGEPVEPLGDGSLALSWQVSPLGCEAAGVETVEVRLENAHRGRSESFACAEGEAIVENISPANYELIVVGFDADQQETFISKARVVAIGAEKINETSRVRLTAKPATAEVAWRFDNGRVCGANGVSSVQVAVYDTASYELARKDFSCDQGVGIIDGLAAGDFIIQAVAEGDETVYQGIAKTSLKRGDHRTVDIELVSE